MARDLEDLPVTNGRVVMAGEGQSTMQDIYSYYYGLKYLAIYIFSGPKKAWPNLMKPGSQSGTYGTMDDT